MNKIRNTISTSLSKRLLISLLAMGMAGHLTGCAMGGSSDESTASGEETFAEESSGDFAEGEEVAEGESTEATESAEGEVAEGSEAAPEDAVDGEMAATEEGAAAEGDDLALEGDPAAGEAKEGDAAAKGDVAAAEGDMADDELSLDDEEGLPSDIAANDAAAEPAPIIDEPATAAPTDAPVFADTPSDMGSEPPADSMAAAPMDSSMDAPAPAFVPVKKMKTAAFMAGDANLNRVYLARPGETRAQIAQKIYGDKARSKDLLKWNSFLGRGVKTGDKIYYSSPTNPGDTNMMTYYEDAGIPAQNYVSRDGDNIREVSKTLLGDKDSWKEVWATNMDVESKGDIPGGLNIRYWPEGSAPSAPMMAQNPPADAMPPADPMTQAPMDPLAQQQPPSMPQNDPLAQPPADPLAPNDPVAMQQPPAHDPMAAAPTGTPASVPPAVGSTMDVPPPAPPADPPAAAPVEQPRHQQQAAADHMAEGGTEEADNMMMMGLAGIVVLAAGAVFFLMRRNRSRKVDLTQTTQVG